MARNKRRRSLQGVGEKMNSEHNEQIRLIAWAKSMDLPLFAIPNGGLRNRLVAAKMKREGVRAGIPDLFLPCASRGAHGLFIEMKREKGGRTSAAQKEWIARLRDAGYAVEVCRGFDEARKAIERYLG